MTQDSLQAELLARARTECDHVTEEAAKPEKCRGAALLLDQGSQVHQAGSSCFQVEWQEGRGRCGVAARQVERGEVRSSLAGGFTTPGGSGGESRHQLSPALG